MFWGVVCSVFIFRILQGTLNRRIISSSTAADKGARRRRLTQYWQEWLASEKTGAVQKLRHSEDLLIQVRHYNSDIQFTRASSLTRADSILSFLTDPELL